MLMQLLDFAGEIPADTIQITLDKLTGRIKLRCTTSAGVSADVELTEAVIRNSRGILLDWEVQSMINRHLSYTQSRGLRSVLPLVHSDTVHTDNHVGKLRGEGCV